MLRKIISGFVLILIAYSCIEPYSLNIDGYDNLLVVDALITDENVAHTVLLRRSTTNIEEESPYESGASVYVTNATGQQYYFAEFSPGTYKSDSTELIVKQGDKFTLHIQTSDGNTYQSDECEILAKTEIDKVYFSKNTEWDENDEYENVGISIYVDGSASESAYVRWKYEEDWKFKTPFPERYAFDEDEELVELPIENYYCWKHNSSNNINVYSFGDQVGGNINSREINFITTGLNDRLTIRYSINVKQLSISREEYEYWRKLSESTEAVGDVFAKQPFSLVGNIQNLNDESEPVLGYFQTGSVVSKRLYINTDDIKDFDVPMYSIYDNCSLDTATVDGITYNTIYEVYVGKVVNGNWNFYDPIYDEMGFSVVAMLLSSQICSDCTVRGAINPPNFWEEE
ncbi:DUF4249 domain-containing protein [Carboxylicivirga caseinilyticus]|uniref:DUF4249 domain-containing protein n=1 Tax=Carboxylicivirga caseinilyticus TaxID=3417572 RepID=UPI003D3280AB|nr:DUF4249 domain-containing protein [Marinilabiliaceae bacterium A049]